MSEPGDLHIIVLFDELQLRVIHEGKAGDLACLSGTLMQLPDRWQEVVAATFTITRADAEPEP
jgi:hypothetical protein